VYHITGEYTCHKPALKPLLAEVRWRPATLLSFTIDWIERTTTRWLTPNHAWHINGPLSVNVDSRTQSGLSAKVLLKRQLSLFL
jgi:hypothetical protein